jgi:hypothetical protein
MRPKTNRRQMAGSRHTNFWSDQTRPDQQPHHQTAVARLVSIEDPWAEGEEGHHSVEFLSGPIILSHATRHGRELHSRPRNELLCMKKISPDFWQTIDYYFARPETPQISDTTTTTTSVLAAHELTAAHTDLLNFHRGMLQGWH